MSKKNVIISIVAGAVCGFAISLTNENNRAYVKEKSSRALETADFYISHPAEGVKNIKEGIQTVNHALMENSDKAINALNQAENSLRKFLK